VTLYEHAMCGATLGLVAGVHRQDGWRIVALAGLAATLPDWDGLTILFGPSAYAAGHRTWGHNLFAAAFLGGLAGAAEHRFQGLSRLRRLAVAKFPGLVADPSAVQGRPAEAAGSPGAVWVITGVLASLSHLAADLVFTGHPDLPTWEVPLLWPFSPRGWAIPLVAWGDVGATLIFIGEMFALYRWPARAQVTAAVTLAAVLGYVGLRWLMGGVYG
jgi:membrane-bound metal-dependent hydrolase YbcI (DUF457 family)